VTDEGDAPSFDLDALRAAMTEMDLPNMDRPDRMFTLGPRWRSGVGLYRTDTERLADLELPRLFLGDSWAISLSILCIRRCGTRRLAWRATTASPRTSPSSTGH